jgi:predicted molibdopterin-dependent oxidoreductase YjgC
MDRKPLEKVTEHPHVIYEPGKCIKCGICVRITESLGEKVGLTFVGRGFDVRVDVSLGKTLDEGLKKAAVECVNACPTGALAFPLNNRAE